MAAAEAVPTSSAFKRATAPVLAVALGGLLKADTVVPHEETAAAPPNHGGSEGGCNTGGGGGGDNGGGCRSGLAPRSTMAAHAAWAAQLNEATNTSLAQAASTEVRRGSLDAPWTIARRHSTHLRALHSNHVTRFVRVYVFFD
jgi:hypothetical protein